MLSSLFCLDTKHGPITADIMNRHVGDLGNVTSDSSGTININIQDSIIQLYNKTQSIFNRTIVLHAMRDDGGMGGFPDSNTTGYAYFHFFFC
jgi:Cu-Zn family superoxide dismutase